MLEFKLNELISAIDSCKNLKEFSSIHKDMDYYIRHKKLTYLYNGIYFYDKEGIVNTCKELYGDKYDLSEFLNDGRRYSTSTDKTIIPIICKKHGKISISIGDLLSGVCCRKCINDRRNDIRFVFNRKKIMYAENKNRYKKYDIISKLFSMYNDVIKMTDIRDYNNIKNNLSFTCKYHGEFFNNLRSILNGFGCPYCNLIKKVSLILSANRINNSIKDGIVYLEDGKSIGINDCDINISLEDNVYDILSSNGIIYDDSKVKERWKDIESFSKYKVSTLGRVMNIESKKITSGHNMYKGSYIQKMINLYDDNGKIHGILLHRLVYSTFKGNITGDINIDHIDGNCLNNRLCNLKACNNIKDNINNDITILSAKINAYKKSMSKKDVVKHNYDISSLEGEEWVNLYGMEDLYEVSNFGRIRSKVIPVEYNRNGAKFTVLKTPKMLKQHVKSGYMFISLGRNKERVHLPVHKIVYESFNGKLEDGLEIDHINSDSKDNRLCNLQAITHADNLAKREFNKDKVYDVISKYYDNTIPDVKNIANIRSKGFKIGKETLRKWRKENGIGRWHSLKIKKG